MRSSTLPSEPLIPRRALCLLLVALAASFAAAIYIFKVDVEMRFCKAAIQKKRSWTKRLDETYAGKTVVVGGSSCAFSIDGERMERLHGLPTANYGLNMAFGPRFLTRLALEACHSGDTLALAFEPELLCYPIKPSSLAVQMSYALGEPHLSLDLSRPDSAQPWLSDLLNFRPGGQHVFTMLGKLMIGQPLYRYRIEEVHPSGWQTTPMRIAQSGSPGEPPGLAEEPRTMIYALCRDCRERHIKLIYSLPPGATPLRKA